MARGQEKVIVPRQDLPPVSLLSTGEYGYIVRYRIVSEDQNRFSHWSPIRELPVPTPVSVSGSLTFNGLIALVTWGDDEARPEYDIFVKIDSGEYIYSGTANTQQYSFSFPDTASTISVAVQIASTTHQRSTAIEIYKNEDLSVVQLESFQLSRYF